MSDTDKITSANAAIENRLSDAVASETPDILDELLEEIDNQPQQASPAEIDENGQPVSSTEIDEAKQQTSSAEIVRAASQKDEGVVISLSAHEDAVTKELRETVADTPQKMMPEKPQKMVTKASQKTAAWIKAVAVIAAVLVLFIGVRTLMKSPKEAFAVVGLDVNPGIEITIDQDERVLSAYPVNDDGEKILADMDLGGSDINVACNAIIGAMLTQGYLTADSNSILVSVRAVEESRGKEIEKDLSQKLNGFLENSEVAAAILGQYVEEDSELKAFAEKNGISLGKAWLIRNLLASGSKNMTEDSLLRLTTQELILLGQNRNVKKEDSYGKASTSKYIGALKAKSIALKQAGFTESKAKNIKAEFDCDDGIIVYEVEFTAGGFEYEYDIDAVTGKVISSDHDKADSGKSGSKDAADDDDDDRDDRDDDNDRYDRDDRDDDDDRYDKNDRDDDDDRDDKDDRDDDDDQDDD